ncbi:MAG: hypothetical protein P9M14_10995 [Candidatus Alcyoniella australis]|nr:hypothetical protein [Candidatus Alcyoniella australis]
MFHHFDFFAPSGLEQGLDLSDDELADQLDGTKSSALFLGTYSATQVREALERFGITAKLAARGYQDLKISYTDHGPYAYRMTIEHPQDDEYCLLGEVIVKEGSFTPKVKFLEGHDLQQMDLLVIEWMLMQDQRREFGEHKPRLPGQNHPGLGVGNEVVHLLNALTKLLSKEGLLNFPEYINNALIYSEFFDFFDPRKQAEMSAIWRDMSELGMDLSQVSWAVYLECVRDAESGEAVKWFAEEQIKPHSPRIKAYFNDPEYAEAVQTFLDNMRYELDTTKFEEKYPARHKIVW